MKTIVWGNYKGGVGKTTSVYQVATYFAEMGRKVLLIDLDPQCSLSNICSMGCNKQLSNYAPEETFNYLLELYIRYINVTKSIDFDLLENSSFSTKISTKFDQSIQKIKNNGNLYYIPSSLSFTNCRINELAKKMEQNIFSVFIIRLILNDIEKYSFDYVFVDCPPTSNILIQSAFMAADYYIVPTIVDEISTKGVADYISEIEKTRLKFSMNDQLGAIIIDKVFGDKVKFVGVFETIYKERRGDADNSSEIIALDKNISNILNVESLLAQDRFKEFRYSKERNNFDTKNIFGYYIGHRDNRTGGESIPYNTSHGYKTSSYKNISKSIISVLEG